MAAAARLRTALGRVGASANVLSSKAAASSNQTQLTLQGTTEQQQETAGVADAMQQMSLAVQEVASGATDTSSGTMDALGEDGEGNSVFQGVRWATGGRVSMSGE